MARHGTPWHRSGLWWLAQLQANILSITQTRLPHLLFSFGINIIDRVPGNRLMFPICLQEVAICELFFYLLLGDCCGSVSSGSCAHNDMQTVLINMSAWMFALPFRRVPEQVAADLRAVGDDRRVVEQRLVSDLHLEEPLVPGGQLLAQSSQQPPQQQQHRVPAFTQPHSERHNKSHVSLKSSVQYKLETVTALF